MCYIYFDARILSMNRTRSTRAVSAQPITAVFRHCSCAPSSYHMICYKISQIVSPSRSTLVAPSGVRAGPKPVGGPAGNFEKKVSRAPLLGTYHTVFPPDGGHRPFSGHGPDGTGATKLSGMLRIISYTPTALTAVARFHGRV